MLVRKFVVASRLFVVSAVGLFWIAFTPDALAWYTYGGCVAFKIRNVYVSTELYDEGGYAGRLRARSGSIGPWEKYTQWFSDDHRYTAFQSRANNMFVSADISIGGGGEGMLIANRSQIGAWESFTLLQVSSSVLSSAYGLTATMLVANSNNKVVSAEFAYGSFATGTLRARPTGNQVGSWELFTLYGC